jgi:hypothetical protein
LARLGLSHQEFDQLTPLELDLALNDHFEYHNSYLKHGLQLIRYVGLNLRNKGMKFGHQITDARKFWKFPWEYIKVDLPTQENWDAWDRRMKKPKP